MGVVLAKVVLNEKSYIVCESSLLKSSDQVLKKMIEETEEVSLLSLDYGEVLNPTNGFVSDLNKIVAKKLLGDSSVYFTGDNGEYYLTDYSKITKMYEALKKK